MTLKEFVEDRRRKRYVQQYAHVLRSCRNDNYRCLIHRQEQAKRQAYEQQRAEDTASKREQRKGEADKMRSKWF
jgi:HD-like signal output (HDOD) protein